MSDDLTTLDPVLLYRREKRKRAKRDEAATAALMAELRVKLEAELHEATKGGRPKSLKGTGVIRLTRSAKAHGHGTRACYQRGCRCEGCKAAQLAYERAWEAKHRAKRTAAKRDAKRRAA